VRGLVSRASLEGIVRSAIKTFDISQSAISSVHFSSATDEWATPQLLFDELDRIFGGFTLDPCATPENAKCRRFFTRSDDGLIQS